MKIGIVYVLHFSSKYKHAQHYIGWTSNLEKRLLRHSKGLGSRLIQVILQSGISYSLANTFEGTRELERKLKNRKKTSTICSICKELKKCIQ